MHRISKLCHHTPIISKAHSHAMPAAVYSHIYKLFEHTSGAHVNPAVTLGFASIQRFPWKKVPIYIASQMLGSIIAAAVVFALYHGKYA